MKKLNLILALVVATLAINNLSADFILNNRTPWVVKMDVGFDGDRGTSAKREVQPYSQLRVTNAGDLWNDKTKILALIKVGGEWKEVAKRIGNWGGNREFTVKYRPAANETQNEEQFTISVSNAILM